MKKPWLLAAGLYLVATVCLMYGAWQGTGQLMLMDMPTANHRLLLAMSLLVAGGAIYGLNLTLGAGTWPALMGGLFYLLNPYSIDRLWSGQWRVLAGYAAAPVVVWLAVLALRRGGRWWWVLALSYAVMPAISQHWWLMLTLAGGPVLLTAAWRRGRFPWRHLLVSGLINLAWIVALRDESGVSQLQPADSTSFGAVATLPGGLPLTVLGLGGFWYHPFDFLPGIDYLWLMLVAGLLAASVLGWRLVVWRRRALAIVLAGCWFVVAGVIMLSGWAPAQPVVQRVVATVPGLVGLRELTKLTGLLALGYATLAPLGLTLWRFERWAAVSGVAIIALAMAPAYGGGPYIKTYHFPSGWTEAKVYLDRQPQRRVVALPYAGYLVAPWAGDRLVANQAPGYFGHDVIAGSSTGNADYDSRRGNSGSVTLADLTTLRPTHIVGAHYQQSDVESRGADSGRLGDSGEQS